MRSKSNSKAAESELQSKVPGISKVFCDKELEQFSESPKGNPVSMIKTFQRCAEKPENMTMLEEALHEKTEKKKQRLNFMKRGKIEGKEQSSETGSRQPLLGNVHFSRPSTPQSVPCASMKESKQAPECDTFRVRCLLVRVEQQLMHTTNIIKKMQENGVQRARISLVGKVMREILHLRHQLFRILDNDPVTLVQIGDVDDLEEFFLNVEDICAAAEEIKFHEPQIEETLKGSAEHQKIGLLESLKGGKGKKDKKSQPQSSKESQAENEDNTPLKTRNTKAELERYRNKTQDGDGQPTISKNEGNQSLKLHKESSLVEDWSDPDTDDEMTPVQGHGPSDSQKYKWPLLNTTDKARIEKEKQLHTLMTEIDGLMEEVGLVDKKTMQTGLTYEVLMGGCEKHVNTNIIDAKKVSMLQNSSTKLGKTPKSQSDQFDEELDKLLAECDAST